MLTCAQSEGKDMLAINKVLLVGKVTDAGPKISWTAQGTAQTSLTIQIEEPGRDGQVFKLFVPIVLDGKMAEQAAESVNAGDLVAIDGKLGWTSRVDKKSGEKIGKLTVVAWSVQVERASTPTSTSASVS